MCLLAKSSSSPTLGLFLFFQFVMKSVHLILLVLVRSCNCASVSTSVNLVEENEKLVPLELPAGYENRIKLLVPELLNQLGIPSSLIPVKDLLNSSVSRLSNGIGYFTSWASSGQDAGQFSSYYIA